MENIINTLDKRFISLTLFYIKVKLISYKVKNVCCVLILRHAHVPIVTYVTHVSGQIHYIFQYIYMKNMLF